MENKEDKTIGTELEKFLERYEINRVRDNMKERILTIVIASLGLIAALAWDDALKHLFEKIFGGEDTLLEQFIFAFVITGVAATVSVYLEKIYTKRIRKEK